MKYAYTYAILRYRHDPLAGETINVGVVVHSKKAEFLDARMRTTVGRLTKAFPDMGKPDVMAALRMIERRVRKMRSNEVPTLFDADGDARSYAHKAMPDEDSCFVWSDLRSGLTVDLAGELDRLYGRFVGRYDEESRVSRDDAAVWQPVRDLLTQRRLADRLQEKEVVSPIDRVSFDYAWKNGAWHCYQPLSFDLASGDSIREKAARWAGHMTGLSQATEQIQPYFIVGMPDHSELVEDYTKAIRLLRASPLNPKVYEESQIGALVDLIEDEMSLHDGKHEVE